MATSNFTDVWESGTFNWALCWPEYLGYMHEEEEQNSCWVGQLSSLPHPDSNSDSHMLIDWWNLSFQSLQLFRGLGKIMEILFFSFIYLNAVIISFLFCHPKMPLFQADVFSRLVSENTPICLYSRCDWPIKHNAESPPSSCCTPCY